MGQQAFCGPQGFCVLESGSRQNRISQTAGSVACGLRTPPSCFQKAGQAGGCHCHWLNPTCWCNNPKVNDSSMEIQDPVYKNKNVPKSHTQTGTRWQLNRTVFSIQGRFLNGAPHPSTLPFPCPVHWCGCAFSPRTPSIPWVRPAPGLSPTLPRHLVGALQCSAFPGHGLCVSVLGLGFLDKYLSPSLPGSHVTFLLTLSELWPPSL